MRSGETLLARILRLIANLTLAVWNALTRAGSNALAHGVEAVLNAWIFSLVKSATNSSNSPGSGVKLDRLARFFFTTKSYERVYQPIISDMQLEYNEALSENRLWHARWIWVRGHLCFWFAVMAHSGVSVVQLIKKIAAG